MRVFRLVIGACDSKDDLLLVSSDIGSTWRNDLQPVGGWIRSDSAVRYFGVTSDAVVT